MSITYLFLVLVICNANRKSSITHSIVWDIDTDLFQTILATSNSKNNDNKLYHDDFESKRTSFFGNGKSWLSLYPNAKSKSHSKYIELYLKLDFAEYIGRVVANINVTCSNLEIDKVLTRKTFKKESIYQQRIIKLKDENNTILSSLNNITFKADFEIIKAYFKNGDKVDLHQWILLMDTIREEMTLRADFINWRISKNQLIKMYNKSSDVGKYYDSPGFYDKTGNLYKIYVLFNPNIYPTDDHNKEFDTFAAASITLELIKDKDNILMNGSFFESNVYCKQLGFNWFNRLDNKVDKLNYYRDLEFRRERLLYVKSDYITFEGDIEIVSLQNTNGDDIDLSQWYVYDDDKNDNDDKDEYIVQDSMKKDWILLTEIATPLDYPDYFPQSLSLNNKYKTKDTDAKNNYLFYAFHKTEISLYVRSKDDGDDEPYHTDNEGILRVKKEKIKGKTCNLNLFDSNTNIECVKSFRPTNSKKIGNSNSLPLIVNYNNLEYIVMTRMNEINQMLIYHRVYQLCNENEICQHYEIFHQTENDDSDYDKFEDIIITSGSKDNDNFNLSDFLKLIQSQIDENRIISTKNWQSIINGVNNDLKLHPTKQRSLTLDLLVLYPEHNMIYLKKSNNTIEHGVLYRPSNKYHYKCYFIGLYKYVDDTYIPNVWYDDICNEIKSLYEYTISKQKDEL